jgi:site-specific DNA-adenine methylase
MSIITIPGLETYFGGKGASGTYQTIINQIPPHFAYYEPFLGAGNILRRKKPAYKNIGIEINHSIIDLWRAVELENYSIQFGDGIQFLQNIAAGRLIFNAMTYLYIDPPYLLSSRKSKKKVYKHELSKDDHETILRSCTQINNGADHNNIYIGISCLENDLYKEYLKEWRHITFMNQTRRGQQKEYLYMNYPEPTELHQYNYLGDDYREREKIQNQIKRNVERLKRMPPLLRNAIVTNIKENF